MQISGVTIQGGMNILPAGGSPSPSPAPTPAPSDPNFSNVVFLFDGDGTNGADNNTFTDSSTNGYTVTESGSVIQGSFSPYGDNWSNYFGAAQSVVASDSAIAMGSGDWTLEFWVYFNAVNNGTVKYLFEWRTGADTSNSFLAQESNNSWTYWNASGSAISSGLTSSTFNVGTWHHVALSRNGSTLRFFVDGANVGSPSDSTTYDSSTITIGNRYTGSYGLDGYISNVRIVKGTALYTSAFTPPTDPLTAITNTQLLTCQSNRFVDESTNNSTITLVGTPKVTPFSPFKDSDARSLATDGGSGLSETASDYLSTPTTINAKFGTNDFTIEGWIYPLDLNDQYNTIFDYGTNAGTSGAWWALHAGSGGSIEFHTNNGSLQVASSGAVYTNQWSHFAVVRSGTTFTIYVNGNSVGSATSSYDINDGTTRNLYTFFQANTARNFNGYLTDARIVKGTAVYTSAFTPPTAPLTAIANTELLLNFQDAAIFDYSGINNIDTIGAQITTAVKKFGTGSVEFNGTSDYLNIPYKSQWDLSSDDFTIEAWAYADTLGSYNSIVGQWPNGGGSNSNSFVLETVGSEMRFYFCSGTNVAYNSLGAISTGSWDHWAVTREGTTLRGFKNGTLVFTNASFGGMNNAPSDITVGGNVAGAGYWDGYIDDLRITKGVARYTSNFTAPTAAFPTS